MKKSISSALIAVLVITCFSLIFSVFATEGAPMAENLEISTYRAVSVGGKLSAADPDGEVVGFEITTAPTKGEVELGEDGCFVYTPGEGKKGKDYFGYKAIDDQGNYSQEATVIIRIQKQKTKVTYSDMKGHESAWAAVMLAEEGIFTGENLAGKYVFSPETPVTRSQFLAMCMKAAGTDLLTNISSTSFSDDEAIAAWAKPYVGTALNLGIISGYEADDAGIVFSPDEPISAAEAAVILDRTMELTDAVAVWFGYEELIPAWAVQSAANLSSLGIRPDSVSMMDSTLSRAEAAEMLCRALAIKD